MAQSLHSRSLTGCLPQRSLAVVAGANDWLQEVGSLIAEDRIKAAVVSGQETSEGHKMAAGPSLEGPAVNKRKLFGPKLVAYA